MKNGVAELLLKYKKDEQKVFNMLNNLTLRNREIEVQFSDK